MVDSQGTEVKKARFPTTCEGLNEFASTLPEGVKVAIKASTSGIFVYEYLDGRWIECESVSTTVEDGLLTGELCSGGRYKGS